MTYRLDSLAAADQGRHDRAWQSAHAERVAYYTEYRDDTLGTATALSDHMGGQMGRKDMQPMVPSNCQNNLSQPV